MQFLVGTTLAAGVPGCRGARVQSAPLLAPAGGASGGGMRGIAGAKGGEIPRSSGEYELLARLG